jgi:hypothetical protein
MNAYTASQIATGRGCSPAAVRQALAPIRPNSCKIAGGNAANAWNFLRLPLALRNDLEAAAVAKGYRNAEHLLENPDALWQPAVPISQRSAAAVQKAVALRSAITPFLDSQNEATPGETDAAIAAAYEKEIGHPITAQGARKLLIRTIERDRNNHDWQRLDIYLDDLPGPKSTKAAPAASSKFDFAPLADTVAAFKDKAAPTIQDREFLFDAAFRHCETIAQNNPREARAIRCAAVAWLLAAVPGVSKSPISLERVFKAKFAQWIAGGRCPDALADKRPAASGNFRRPDLSADEKKIRDTAILHGGNESLAHRILRQRGQLSPEFCNHHKFDPRRAKSRVPETVRDEITPDVKMCGPLPRGPWEAKMRGPYIQRGWTGVQPGDRFNADDVTWNSYFWFYDADGQLKITRGECLLLLTCTGYPLDFKLIAGKYNGEHIRCAILRAHDLHGLPDKGFYFEKGVWKSRLVTGETRKNLVHWRDAERGLRDYGLDLQVRHATTLAQKQLKACSASFRIASVAKWASWVSMSVSKKWSASKTSLAGAIAEPKTPATISFRWNNGATASVNA